MILENSQVLWPPNGQTISDTMLAEAAKHCKENKAYLIDGTTDEKRYFSELEDETKRIASHFHRKGMRKGDIVVFMSLKQINLVIMQCGIWRANGILRSIYVEETLETIKNVITESKAKWVICDGEQAPELLSLGCTVGWPVEIVVCETGLNIPGCSNFEDYLRDDGSFCPRGEIDQDDIALIVPTSGSTGPSKGAVHTHKSLLISAHSFYHFGYRSSVINVAASRATHISGILFPIGMVLWGSTAVVLPTVTPELLAQTVEKYKAACVFAMPSYALTLSSGSALSKLYDMSSIESIVTGGSPVTPEILTALHSIGNVKQVIVVYGMSESPGVSSTRCFDEGIKSLYRNPVNYSRISDFTVGKVFPGVTVQFRDMFDSEKILGPGEKGELCIKGDLVFKGYFQNPEKTEQSFVDGWLKSGDVGYCDEDGFIYIIDRCKDIFKYKGNHISPTEIENVLTTHHHVSEACVIGVADLFGEVPRAFVTLIQSGDSIQIDKETLAEDIKAFANSKLASYKHIRGGLVIIDAMPRGKSGKVTRNLLRGN